MNRAQGHRPRAQAACGRRDLVGGEVVGAKEDGAPAEAGRDRAGDFTTLFAAAEAAGLAGTLADGGPFTVFAPTDAAFADVPAETLQALLADPDAPAEVLLYHVVPERVLAGDLVEGALVTTAEGRPFGVTLEGGAKVNGANVRRGMSWPRWEDPVGLRRLSFARSRTRTASKAPEGPSSTSAGPKGRSQRNSGRPLRA